MTTIIPAHSAQKFLSVLPHLCGFVPQRSIVFVPIADGRSRGLLRLDLPSGEEQWNAVTTTALGILCRIRQTDRFALVVYTDDPLLDHEDGMTLAGLVERIRVRADDCGFELIDALCVAGDAWGSYLDDGIADRPLAEIAHDGAVPDGAGPLPVLADQATAVELPTVERSERDRVKRALGELDRAIVAILDSDESGDAGGGQVRGIAGLPPRAVAAACLLDQTPEVFEDALDWNVDELDPYLAAVLIVALDTPVYRDVALSQWSADRAEGYRCLTFNERWQQGDQTPLSGPIRLMGEGRRPRPERLERAHELARRLAATAPRRRRAGALVAAAWLSWALGGATQAGLYAEKVLALDPDHGLASIVMTMVSGGYLPPWAFERPAAA